MEAKELGVNLALINKVQTTIDGGVRVTLDFGMDAIELAQKLTKKKMEGEAAVMVAFVEAE